MGKTERLNLHSKIYRFGSWIFAFGIFWATPILLYANTSISNSCQLGPKYSRSSWDIFWGIGGNLIFSKEGINVAEVEIKKKSLYENLSRSFTNITQIENYAFQYLFVDNIENTENLVLFQVKDMQLNGNIVLESRSGRSHLSLFYTSTDNDAYKVYVQYYRAHEIGDIFSDIICLYHVFQNESFYEQ